jgi:uncharacterized iron-regulated membrane protein
LVVFVVALSGCLYVFEREIQEWLQDYRYVDAQSAPVLPPSRLKSIAQQQLPGETAARVYYEGPGRAAYVQFGNKKTSYYKLVYVNPYDGRVLKVKDMNRDLFHIIFSVHYRLLMRPDVGTAIVDWCTLVFVLILASGLANWWPRNRAAARQRFWVKWKARWRRRNYDLHHVLGFYAFPAALIIALTGLVWGFQWFNDTVHWIVSGGQTRQAFVQPASNGASAHAASAVQNVDTAWSRLSQCNPDAEVLIVFFPATPEAAIRYVVNPDQYTYYKTDHYYFDPFSLTEMPVEHAWGKCQDATTAGMVRRMNYDIHTGAILGLPGKMLAFFASLVAASLPVTGLLIWWGRRNTRRTIRVGSTY